ncbi:MAG: O-acetyl-ADP-ribose deacetylase [Calditrichaeota bacterium]|nr:O-acetyl-ADP-ribose deacetylase [Calditrichota bacterium]
MNTRITLVQGDITTQQVDAIVNAANERLLGGGGVDGAIHRAAGPQLLAECRTIGGCPTGEARITKGYRLPARFVIHTVGPIWQGGERNEPELLASCYRSSLQLAVDNGVKTVAFPSISTGVYGFPIELAAPIAIGTVQDFLADETSIEEVRFVCFSAGDKAVYEQELRRRGIPV